MNRETTIIRCSEEHTDAVTALIISLLKDFNERSGSNFVVDRDAIAQTVRLLLRRNTYGCFIAKAGNVSVGLITIAPCFAVYNGGDFGVITELYVDAERRSLGIGKLLLDKAAEFAKENNWSRLEVGAPNAGEWPRTLAFYKQNGFLEKGPKLRINL